MISAVGQCGSTKTGRAAKEANKVDLQSVLNRVLGFFRYFVRF